MLVASVGVYLRDGPSLPSSARPESVMAGQSETLGVGVVGCAMVGHGIVHCGALRPPELPEQEAVGGDGAEGGVGDLVAPPQVQVVQLGESAGAGAGAGSVAHAGVGAGAGAGEGAGAQVSVPEGRTRPPGAGRCRPRGGSPIGPGTGQVTGGAGDI